MQLLFSLLPEPLTELEAAISGARLQRFMGADAIFDLAPEAEYDNLKEVVGWVSPRAMWFIEQLCDPASTIADRPQL